MTIEPSKVHITRPLYSVPWLAAMNLRHEWVLTACLVIALTAVIAPLLVLLGLKHGTISTLRDRLVEDPVYREIRPAQTYEFDEKWFLQASQWPEIEFITPTILPLSSILHVVHPVTETMDIYDLIPTAEGDPLLLENGAPVPEDGESVITSEAARRLGLDIGDQLEVRVTRSRGGRSEMAETQLEIAGVLEPRAGLLPRIYAPLSLVKDVEAYKEGYGAPHRGWSGDNPMPFLSYDGVILILPQDLDPITRSGLIINTGFARIEHISEQRVFDFTGIFPPADWHYYNVYTPGGVVTTTSIRALEQKMRGRDRVLLPYAKDIYLENANGQKFQPAGISLDDRQSSMLGVPNIPWGGFSEMDLRGTRLLQAIVDESILNDLQFTFYGDQPVSFPVQSVGSSFTGQVVLPVELIGILRTATQRGVAYDPQAKEFSMIRGGYRGFRIYTSSIDHIPGLYQKFQSKGIETIAQVESIQRIQVLDAGLSRLFVLIALLSVSGGAAVLLSSLYAAVERLRRDLGILRLVGLSRRDVFFFPVVQGLLLAGMGLLAGFGGYTIMSWAINNAFAAELAQGEKFCTIPSTYVFTAIIVTLLLAVGSSLAAALRATQIDPAEVIRE